MIHPRWMWLLFWGCLTASAGAQVGAASPSDTLVVRLTERLQRGDPQHLRDLGSLLETGRDDTDIRRRLRTHLLLPAADFPFLATEFSRQDFFDFYYERREALFHDPAINAFRVSDWNAFELAYTIHDTEQLTRLDATVALANYQGKLTLAIESENYGEARSVVDRIDALETDEAITLLLRTLTDRSWWKSDSDAARELAFHIARLLGNAPDRRTAETLLELTERGDLPVTATGPLLAKITNVGFDWQTDSETTTDFYRRLLDSIPDMERLRNHGFERIHRTRVGYFPDSVDYYGFLLTQADTLPWIRANAIRTLVRSGHPRTLFYLAADLYRRRGRRAPQFGPDGLVQTLTSLTQHQVEIEGRSGSSIRHDWSNDPLARRNFLLYWAQHYQDYEYSPTQRIFINKQRTRSLRENYERLFRRLNSRNDSVAMEAFLLLTEGDPEPVRVLANKYRELLRNFNPTLPDLRYRYLEQLSVLTDFCRRNGVHYRLNPRLQHLTNQLLASPPPSQRHRLENDLLTRLTLEDVTGLEYWGLLHAAHAEIQLSLGRILDRFYSAHWSAIIGSERRLRLYLKKSILFDRIGVVGVCNKYLRKFGAIDESFGIELIVLRQIESDDDVITAIDRLLGRTSDVTEVDFGALLETVPTLSRTALRKLPAPDSSQFPLLFDFVLQQETDADREPYLTYLKQYVTIAQVPEIFRLLQLNVVPEKMVALLEKVYGIPAGTTVGEWWVRFEADPEGYRDWGRVFFNDLLEEFRALDSIPIGLVNRITRSPYFTDTLRPEILTALSRVRPVRNLRRLRLEPRIDPIFEMHHLEGLQFPARDLDNLTSIFAKDTRRHIGAIVRFLLAQAEGSGVTERGVLINGLMRMNWFINYVTDGHLSPEQGGELWLSLEMYLRESEYLSGFEEQNTLRNIVLLSNVSKPLVEKLQATAQADIDDESRAAVLRTILSRIEYADIGTVVPFLEMILATETETFLTHDFGIPIYDLDDPQIQQKLRETHQKFDRWEFYHYWLDQFGVDYQTPTGALDYDKILDILRFDLVSPFVGDGGFRRDFYVYGIIKILEIEHGTRLGFTEKLNENQTFYTFTARKRADAWIDFLYRHRLSDVRTATVPSFSREL